MYTGLVFRFVLAPGSGRVFDRAKEFFIFFFEMEFEKLLFIAVPKKIAELVDEVPNFQGDLGFFLILHFSPHGVRVLSRFGMGFSFAIGGYPQRRAIDADGDTVVFETIQEGVHQGLSLEEVIPFRVV